ncbi:hypothetical protein GGS20DRAFT_322793 [Poronia punctata]|nr:hypothetical protein GGS20DRAFT_322793 [Poronia punctata]
MSSISQALREIPASPSPSPSPSPSRNLQPTATSPSPRSRRSSSRVSLAPHDVTDETPPNDRFDQPALQKALRDTENLMSDLAVVLRSGSIQYEPDSVMKRLSKRADELVKFQCPPTRIVGFVGDSGAGKSSLLNSLLDYRGLARTSNIGGACTCVVTEYHHHPSSLFAIDVERFSGSEIKDQVLNLLRDLRHFHLNRSTLDSDEVRDLQDRADLARDTFKSMFRGTFTEEAFLLSGSETMVYDKLKTWVRELQQQQQEEEEVQTGLKENMSFEECARLILQLTSEETESDGPALWPWIKRIKVYLNAHVLSKGLVLVDLPGLRDLNAARRSVTERYLLQCDEIFVVANIGRAITDVSVSDVIERAKKARLANVGIICTKSDDISADEALTDWKGQRAKEVRRKRDGIRKHERVITEIEEELSQFDEEDEDDLFEDERDEIVRLNSKLRTARKQRDELVFDLQKYLIENRNTLIEKKLVDHYQAQVPAPSPAHHNPNPLRVFCASNTLYWHQREHPRDKAMRYLSLSGIISIRAHCMEMVSESQYVASKKYMKDDVGVLLGELDLWVQSGQGSLSAERKDAVRKTLDTLERNLSTKFFGRASPLNQLGKGYRNEFYDELYLPQSSSVNRWGSAAIAASIDWSGWHHSTYAAFCRNFGTHYTAAVKHRNWNQEIIQAMSADLDRPWQTVQERLNMKNASIIELIDNLFHEQLELLGDGLSESPGTRISLDNTLSSRGRVLRGSIEDILGDLDKHLRTLRTDALSSLRTSFIGKVMEGAYNQARMESGGGSDARRKAIIHSSVARWGLFADLLEEFRKGFRKHAEDAQKRVEDLVRSQFEQIQGTLNIVRNENAALESERDPAFRRRVQVKLEATKSGMSQVCTVVELLV